MIKHLFKLSWNKKKQHFLIIVEVFVSFIVLFAVFSLLIFQYRNYKVPMGFEYKNGWVINIFPEDRQRGWDISDSAASYHENVVQTLKSFPEVLSSSFSFFNTPFVMGQSSNVITYNNIQYVVSNYITDDNYDKVLDLKMLEGRWYKKQDEANANKPVVINRTFKEKLFQSGQAVGKTLLTGEDGKSKLMIVGVVNDFKDKGDFAPQEDAIYMRMDDNDLQRAGTIIVKMKPGSGADIEARLLKSVFNAAKNANVQIQHLTDLLKTKNKVVLVPTIILLIISGFLIINVGLGLFGILWYNINKRKSEIGLRRAVGATTKSIYFQLIGESLAMSTIAIVTGLFFAIQFPLLNIFGLPADIYVSSIFISAVFIYFLVFACSIYPGRQATCIQPANVLHED